MRQLQFGTIFFCLLILWACDSEPKLIIEDEHVYTKAINDYLQKRHMKLAVKEYRDFNWLENGNGQAIVALTYAGEDGPKVQVTYEFILKMVTYDKWQVESHKKVY